MCTYKATNSRLRGSTVSRRVVGLDIERSSVPAFNVRKKLCSRDNSRIGSILSGRQVKRRVIMNGAQSDKRDKQPNIYFADCQAVCMNDLADTRHRKAKKE